MAHTPIYRSIYGDVPYLAHPRIAKALIARARTLERQADAWEQGGFHSNARYWRKEARVAELDSYRMMVYIGKSEEDEDLEAEIEAIITA